MADFEATIRNAGGDPEASSPLRNALGKRNDLPDGTRILWRMEETEAGKTIEIQIENPDGSGKYEPKIKVRYEL